MDKRSGEVVFDDFDFDEECPFCIDTGIEQNGDGEVFCVCPVGKELNPYKD